MAINNSVDRNFYGLIGIINEATVEQLEGMMKEYLNDLSSHELYPYMLASYNAPESEGFWGRINPKIGDFELIINRAKALKEHISEIRWLYENLSDYRSKDVLYGIIANWITFNWEYLKEIKERRFKDYFDFDIIPNISEDEVFVDIGGYIGDTVVDFVEAYGEVYSHIISYEVDPENYEALVNNTSSFISVDVRNKGVGEKEGKMYVTSEGSTTKIKDMGELAVEIVSLDDDVKEKITWVKMDIEGAEQSAIRGMTQHIINDKPKLTICTYHNNEDIWKIPMMIKELNSDYRLFMRYYGGDNSLYPCEYVLYCI